MNNKRLKLKVWILILVVFVLGGATGASIDALYRQREMSQQKERLAKGSSTMLELMQLELDLTDEQIDQLEVVFTATRKEMAQQKLVQCPALKEIRDRSDAKIRELLTHEQRVRFRELRAKRDAELTTEKDGAPKE